jgi:hypothetical protein
VATVADFQNQSIAWANDLVNQGKALTEAAQQAIQGIDSGTTDYSIPLAQAFKEPDKITRPTLHSVAFEAPTEPVKPGDYQHVSPIVVGATPIFDIAAPTLTMPSRPSEIGTFDVTAPVIDIDARFPTPPAALENPMFQAPTLGTYETPDKPNIVLPSFDALAPDGEPVALGDLSSRFVASAREQMPQLMDAVEAKLDGFVNKYDPNFQVQRAKLEDQLSKFLDGGTGFKPEVENAIHERSRDKISAEYLRNIAAVDADGARRGFTIPSGAMNAARLQLRVNAGDNLARSAIDIATKQAELEQANLQFAVTASSQIRTSMLQIAVSQQANMITVMSAAIDFANDAVGFMVQGYNAALEGFKYKLNVYQVKATVFETQLRGALAGIEVYKAEIDALQALTNVDRSKVELYAAQLGGLQTLANVYKTQVDATVAKADLEKIKLDIYRTQAEVFSVQTQAKNAEWGAYSAAIQGEQAKLGVYESQARVFQTKIDGYQAQIQSETAKLDASIRQNEALTRNYEAETRTFAAIVQARSELARNDLANQSLAVQAYQVEAAAAVAEAQSRASYYASVNQVGIEQARLFTQQSIERGKMKLEKTKAIADSTIGLGRTIEGAAGAAMSGVVSLAASTKSE